ncbi:MAG: arsenate reductase ArsC [Sulfuricaulis sp.]|uniref:arsenate reductase ArsC n=1 Tax=Sulfuricaulis sp. TaxID=2003553 RepID=UPI003C4E9D65
MRYPIRVLFLCTGNSARSQMAEGLLRTVGGADFEVHSAGTEPKELHPLAVEVMRETGIDIAGHKSKPLERFLGQQFDYIITVCDRARDSCPTFPGDNQRIHWGFEDPAAVTGSRAEQLTVFRRVRNEISERLRVWVTVQRKRLKEIGQPV